MGTVTDSRVFLAARPRAAVDIPPAAGITRGMRCFSCGRETVLAAGERVGFRDACDCGADLHVCRNCVHHDPAAYNECREPQAERVRDRDRANRCEWFQPGGGAGAVAADPRQDARSALDRLFKK